MNQLPRYLIAEIGINHNGDFQTANLLIEAAAEAGANAIKFQYRNLSRAYNDSANEIGDEALKVEIKKNFLSPEFIEILMQRGKKLGLDVGISFFDSADIGDFSESLSDFDFFKVPSVELSNSNLISELLRYQKTVFISTGAHNEEEIENVFSKIKSNNWTPLHCISNYPTLNINSRLGYITYLTKKWGRQAGYSSHDENWEVCLIAYMLGARVIERHITLDKAGSGLDHTTSSTPSEFKKISEFMNDYDLMIMGNSHRITNQGELINLQNLSKSYFALRDINSGEVLRISDFEYRHPRTGLSASEFESFLGAEILHNCKKGTPITKSHFNVRKHISNALIKKVENLRVALPVRLHDYSDISDRFPISNFELHLSSGEIDKLDGFKPISSLHKFSIHLPDYRNSTRLLNPFSNDFEENLESEKIINSIKNFGNKIAKSQKENVILVASFSLTNNPKPTFYQQCRILQDEFSKDGLVLSFQWLPPFAWYFGGSQRLKTFNNLSDIRFILENNLNICLDTSHLLMGSKYFKFDPNKVLDSLNNQIVQLHISDARGFDGEGIQLGRGDIENYDFLKRVLDLPQRKVIEVWQGHLNSFEGFQDALESIENF